jgi:DNA-binding NarL/FixJ family response regulator
LLDVAMPRLAGLQAARQRAERLPRLRILMVSVHNNEQYL